MLLYRGISCILSCISFVLLLVAQASSGWAVHETDILEASYTGLWTTCTEDGCSFLAIRELKLDVVRSFMLVALFFSFLAILCSVESKYWMNCTEDFFMDGPMAAVFSLTSGICVLVAVVVFDNSVRETTEPQLQDPSAKWAYFLSCVVCALCLGTGIFSMVLYQLSLWKPTAYSSQVAPKG
ncbi:uncharacterized protein LOC144328605 [Podarcis muralis]